MEHLKYTPDMARDWKNAIITPEGYLKKRVLDSMNASQLESKLWLVETLIELDIEPKRVALLAGWFAQYIVPLLFDNFRGCEWVENFEIDHDVSPISYKFNKRYKDKNIYKRDMNERYHGKPLYVLQSSNATQHDDHINCVESEDELIQQSRMSTVLYSGSKILSNESTRFMVIGQ